MIEKSKPSRLHVSKPKAGWLLLPRAVFRFGVADEADAIANSSSKNEAMEAAATSLPQLHAILKETSGATRVEIDPAQCTFVFQFSHRGSTWGGPPWALLENIYEAKPSLDPRADAEALFNKEGLVTVGDEEAAIGLREHGAVRRATGLVWRQYMLHEFDRAVAANEIALFARVGSAIAPFEALPPDVWPLLNMLDWQNAIARELGATHAINPQTQSAPEAIRRVLPLGVDFIVDTTANANVLHDAVALLAPRGTLGMVGGAPKGLEFPLDVEHVLTGGRTVRGIIEGDANPDVFLPKLIDLFVKGKFPIDRLVTFYPFARINDAIADALGGKVVKPILRF